MVAQDLRNISTLDLREIRPSHLGRFLRCAGKSLPADLVSAMEHFLTQAGSRRGNGMQPLTLPPIDTQVKIGQALQVVVGFEVSAPAGLFQIEMSCQDGGDIDMIRFDYTARGRGPRRLNAVIVFKREPNVERVATLLRSFGADAGLAEPRPQSHPRAAVTFPCNRAFVTYG